MITITDTTGTSGTITVEQGSAAEAIRGWYPDAPAEVLQALTDLQQALDRGEYTGGLETALGIRIAR